MTTVPDMLETVLTNALVVTPARAFTGSVCLRGGLIAAVHEGPSRAPGAVDCDGDLLVPGLIEMHTDNVERHLEPRPGVLWPSPLAALMAHDAQCAAAGITTVLDAIAVGDYHDDGMRAKMLGHTVDGLRAGRAQGLFRADHRIHIRCELSDRAVVEGFEPFASDPLVQLISLMDHTPGQRQWWDLERMRTFHSSRRTYTDAEFERYVRERQAQQALYAESHRRRIIDLWRPRGLPMAAHDDTTCDHVRESLRDGVTISEFPTTLEAARFAHEHGIANVMGAPNLVRGGSHSGNVPASDLAGEGILDVLSSDYVPVSLLHGALKLADEHAYSLPDAFATVTVNVARMLGLEDRGVIEIGKRADLARVRRLGDGGAAVRGLWREGVRVT